MFDLTITPHGHLLLRETTPPPAALRPQAGPQPSRAALAAFQASVARGMLYLASEEPDAALPPAFDFARSIARIYLTHLCRSAIGQPGRTDPRPRPALGGTGPRRHAGATDDRTGIPERGHPGGLVARPGPAHAGRGCQGPGGVQGYLRGRDPRWRFVGRVTLHLAENKRNPDHPFAFLATFANGLTAQGKVKHEPLSQALRQYAGGQNRDTLLALLLPISKAAESSEFLRELVESWEIYHPQAWTAREAYRFLQAIPCWSRAA